METPQKNNESRQILLRTNFLKKYTVGILSSADQKNDELTFNFLSFYFFTNRIGEAD